MTAHRYMSNWAAVVLTAVFVAGWAQADDKPRESAASKPDKKEQATVDAGRPDGLSDAQIAAWLILQHHREVEISKWASEKADSEQVKSFATVMAAQHGKMIAKLHSAGLVDKKSAEVELGQVLQKLATRVEARLSEGEGRLNLGFRGDEKGSDSADDRRQQRAEDRKQLREQREDNRDTRQARRNRRSEDDDKKSDEAKEVERADVRDERRELRDERTDSRRATPEERRENVRQFMREAMPFVRENLPVILEVVGESVETAAEGDARSGWIDFQRQVAQKQIRSVKDQLDKQSGSEFDEAFIAYQVGAHVQMINTLEVAQNYVSSDMRATVDRMLATTKEHLTHAQQLMQKFEDPSGSGSQR